MLAIDGGDSRFLLHCWAFGAALYASTIGYLLRYVFQRDVVTADKLNGAAAYLMLGALFLAILIARLAGVYPPRRQEAGT